MGQTKTTELSNLHEVSVKSWFSSLRESLSWEQQTGAAGSGISPRAAQTQQSCASPHLALGTPLTHSGRGCTQNLGLWPFPVTPQLQTELVAREGELTAHLCSIQDTMDTGGQRTGCAWPLSSLSTALWWAREHSFKFKKPRGCIRIS